MSKKKTATQDKIKSAALRLFHSKGFSSTSTRDIAREADTNLALLNYHFGSKENLFELLMDEVFSKFEAALTKGAGDNENLESKIQQVIDNYTELLVTNPDMALFLLSEIRYNEKKFLARFDFDNEHHLINQIVADYQEGVSDGVYVEMNPINLFINIISLVIFPFVDRPLLQAGGNLSDHEFMELMEQRRQNIAGWIMNMIKR